MSSASQSSSITLPRHSWDWQARLRGLLLALAATKVVGQQGTESAWAPRATLYLSAHWSLSHVTRHLQNLQGRSSHPPPPSSQPTLQGEVNLGGCL